MIRKKIEQNGLVIISLGAALIYWCFDSLFPGQLLSRVIATSLFVIYGVFTQFLLNSFAKQRDLEAKYHDLVDHITDGVCRLNGEGYFTFGNKMLINALGIPQQRLDKTHFLDIVVPEDRVCVNSHFEDVMRNQKQATLEFKYRRADGKARSIEIRSNPIYMNEKIIGLQSIARDITERKRMEGMLEEANEMLKTLFRASPTSIITLDLEERVTLWNPASESAFGWTESEVLGKGLPFILEDQRDDYLVLLDGVSRGRSFTSFEFRCHAKNGSTVDVNMSLAPLRDTSGNIVGMMSTNVDITERKRAEEMLRDSEERYRALVEIASDIVYRTDDTGHFTFVNPAGLHISGYEKGEVIGRHYLTLIRPDMREDAARFFGRQFVKGIPNVYSEYPIIAKDGHEIWFGQNTQLIFRDGKVVGFQSVARDITDRKRRDEAIWEMSIRDHLTKLYNRRGFITLTEQQLKASNRAKKMMALTFIDVDQMKAINDLLGHDIGDKALVDAADIIRKTARESDIAARIGGDEFAIVTTDINPSDVDIVSKRLQQNVEEFNILECRPYTISLSYGTVPYDPAFPASIDELLSKADKFMYRRKGEKNQSIKIRPDGSSQPNGLTVIK